MTTLQARRLSVGDGVIYDGVMRGVVTAIKMNSTVIQWVGGRATEVPHDQMDKIERT